MRNHHGRVLALVMVVALAGCTDARRHGDGGFGRTAGAERCTGLPERTGCILPTAAFADIREDPVSEEVAAEFQAILRDMAEGGWQPP